MLLLKSLCILFIIRITYEQRSDPGVPCPNHERGVCRYKGECSESDRHGDCGADINYTILVCCIASVRSPDLKYYTIRQLPDRTQCGQSGFVNKIYNGDQTAIGEYPWMAALQYVATNSNTYHGVGCGGTLITEKFILTAAHCVINQTPESIRVLLGDWNITSNPDYYIGGKCDMCTAKNESAPLVINATIDKIILHELYSSKTMRNDIALLRLETPVNFTGYVRPVCLPTEDFPGLKSDDRLWLTGWGTTETDSPSDVLLKAKLYFLAEDKCLDKIQRTEIHKTEFCAYNTDSDACRGDSGGPLIKSYKDSRTNWFQLGIVGSGSDCSFGAVATIYTRVSSFVNWIIAHIKPQAERGSRCKTPDNKNGKCVSVSDCPVLEQQYVQPRDSSEVELVRRSLCGFDRSDESDLVCCRVSALKRDPCTTPNGEIGECRHLSHCPELLDAFSSVTNATEAYLRGFNCEAREEGLPVCCVTSSNSTIVLKKDEPKLVDVPIEFLETHLCGLQHRDDYESSSTTIAIDEFPWVAIIGAENEFLAPCSGALINSRYVISTGFCVVHSYIDTTLVQFGNYNQFNETFCVKDPDTNLSDCTETEKYGVEAIILHPFYLQKLNNIGLLRLNKTVTYTDFIRPICLPIPGTVTPKVGDVMYWSGWGFHDNDSKRGIKKKVLTQLIHEDECKRQFPAYSNIKHWNIICTLDYQNDTNRPTANIFEQGGPLVFHNDYQWYIAGLVWLPTRRDVPNSYVNVLKYINWIIESMKPW